MNKKLPILGTLLLAASITGYSQVVDTTDVVQMADFSLEQLMNVNVVSASKKSESAFEAPLSIGSINKDEIQKSGATSIVEALRLIPGLLVTEVSNGNYQVEIRGLNNLPIATGLNNASNSITLVMIDNRPVYNYFNGGTFWETLPVDLNDVEQIEVVRGASSALYGPNAAAGVINIITRKIKSEGLYAVQNVQYGTKTFIQNASVGYKKGKFDFIVSGNYQNRTRFQKEYYSWLTNSEVEIDSMKTYLSNGTFTTTKGAPNVDKRYPDPTKAMDKFGYNAFMNYAISEKNNIALSFGGQQSMVQKAFIDNLATPLTTSKSNTHYVDARGRFNNLNTMVAYQGGTQDVALGIDGYKYDFNTVDAVAEYDIHIKDVLSFRPGINYRNATYNDSKYSDIKNGEGFINGSRSLMNYAGSLRGELKLKSFKLISAIRVDKYNNTDKAYTSYQITPSLKLSDRHFLRANYAKSYRGPNMYDTYNSNTINAGMTQVAPGVFMPIYAVLEGNTNLKLLGVQLIELGYRGKLTDNFHIDLDLFHQTSENYSYLVNQPFTFKPDRIIVSQSVENINMKAKQMGVTISANYVKNKLQFKPFVTIQSTKLTNAPKYRNSVAADSVNNINVVYKDTTHTGTPGVFGGAYINYKISNKFNANITAYYFGSYKYNNIYTLVSPVNPENGLVDIPSKVLINAKIGYKPTEELELFVNLRNALNQTSFEFARTDKTQIMFLVGASLKY